jgi:polar amino acid transport system substrate-binding protein
LAACADQAEMPPFAFRARADGRPLERIVGASVDLLRWIGESNRWNVDVQLLPWARCLANVAGQQVQVAINVDKGDAEANGLLVSKPFFTMHHVYFYSRKARPEGIKLRTVDDIHHYRVCGLSGYRFESFGIRTDDVDRGTVGYEELIAKLHIGRCDLFIASRETVGGMYLINPRLRSLLVDGNLVSQPLPWSAEHQLYFAVSATADNAKAMIKQLDMGIDHAEKTGEFQRLLDHYLE